MGAGRKIGILGKMTSMKNQPINQINHLPRLKPQPIYAIYQRIPSLRSLLLNYLNCSQQLSQSSLMRHVILRIICSKIPTLPTN